ncbi:guanine nucleotide-binding protein-like NSN1 [Nicotiana tabacum]|uniref:Guanine nucleotide-binding protein-like NSN1 n=2 Tax=Nicotiana TaxID=4085 RepID=A0A1S4DG19_TOBAC|nr:PREDICTED: guanine nucleotide-binding protein-like 3 homolog [Nicotiana sylvestris]XP_016512291.1 PREDICTED: guanine nucleotide-binding protein-like NSN1 [Nicotiana tabacum]
MVKKSKKSKSKRVSLKKKHKIIRKVKEHHKKKSKEAKKLGLNKKSKVEKDPGIPNDWPFKEQELKALEARRARALEELEQKKAARKERAKKRKLGLLEDDDDKSTPADMTSTKQNNFEEGRPNDGSTSFVKHRDNSERAFYKELVKVIDASDVILEVLDARDPLGTRCLDMEKMVIRAGPDKHLVLLLNKIDLIPREAAEKWLKYLREELPTVAFKCSTQEQKSNLGWKPSSKAGKSKTSNLLQTSDCLGAETLIKLLKNYSRSHEIKKSITVGVIGLPNVGKSSLINSLKRSHVVNVGATPGLTRSLQEVQLDKNVKLLDCPGVVMLRSASEDDASIALRNCKRIEKLDDPVGPVKEILKLCPERMLVTIYKVPTFDSVDDFLQKVATVRGRLKKGGIVDVDAAARIVLHDWNEGKIPYYTLPPTRNEGEHSEATIVSELGKEFNIDEVYGSESSIIGSLKSVNDFNPVEVPSNHPVNFDENMLEDHLQQPLAENDNSIDNPVSENGDEPMDSGEGDAVQTRGKSASSRQNEKLYAEEGMLNTKQRKAEKKRRKKDKPSTASDMMDDDYDFKVDYVKKDSAMDDAEDTETTDGSKNNRFELPSGVDLDNE